MIIAMPTISIESGHVWSDLTSRSYSETLSLQLQRCGTERERARLRSLPRHRRRTLARSSAPWQRMYVRPRNDPRKGRRRTTGGRGTKRKRRPPAPSKGGDGTRDCRLRAGGRAGVRRASEKEKRGGERALLLHFQGKGLTKARDGGRFLDIIAGFLRHCPNLPDLARYKKA